MRLIACLALFWILAGCGAEPATNSVDAISPAEADALNDAAEMLDQTEPPPRLTNETATTPMPPEPAR
ncbi:MAG: hypothetical protein AABY88_04880 [Pseudomonadota bacterium]